MEVQSAIVPFLCLRHAIEVNKRDYRAWYGLGQTYEILKMPFYCLYYYRKAHQLRYELHLKDGVLGSLVSIFFFWKIIYFIILFIFCRPNDSRMLVALGESYEKLSQQAEAKKVQI